MATTHQAKATSGAAPALARREYLWGTYYKGTAEAIVTAGLARVDQLPGAPGRGKNTATYYRGEQQARAGLRSKTWDEHYLKLVKVSSRKFVAMVGINADERQAREARADQARQLEVARVRQARELASMPQSHEDFKKRAEIGLRTLLVFLVELGMKENEGHGYSFSADTINEFEIAAGRLSAVLAMGTTEYDARKHQARIAQVKGATAKADGPLQVMLAMAAVQAACSHEVAAP